ncbi:TPA: thymidylate synthase [Raoultella planticola]
MNDHTSLNGVMTDAAYAAVMLQTLEDGYTSDNRTGINTTGTCFIESNYPLYDCSVPLISCKAVNLKPLLVELEWYLKGTGDVSFLREHGVKIWDAWTRDDGSLGPVYGKQWRRWEDTRIVSRYDFVKSGLEYRKRGYRVEGYIGIEEDRVVLSREIDQLQGIVDKLRNNPSDRRMLMSAWNVGELEDMALPPCHFAYSVWSREVSFDDRKRYALGIAEAHKSAGHNSKYTELLRYDVSERLLDELGIPRRILRAGLMQRSVDVFVGMPFNIAGYGILSHMLAHITNHFPSTLSHFGCDVHVYENHLDAAETFFERDMPLDSNPIVILPETWKEIDDFKWEDVRIENYRPLPWIKVPVAV